jgi:Condensation domain
MTATAAPTSAGQRLLLMMEHYRSASATLSCPVLCRVRGPLDVAALGAAVDTLVRRHESLRTTFRGRGPEATQQINPPCPVPLCHLDLTAPGAPTLQAAIADELRNRIDISSESVRARLWRVGDAEHAFCLNMHHLVTDAWSSGILYRELGQLYRGNVGDLGAATALPPVRWQYRHFVEWQNRALRGEAMRRQRSYWMRRLAGARPVALPRPPVGERGAAAAPAVARTDLAADAVAGAQAFAREARTTPFSVLLSAFYAHLHLLSGRRDLTVATLLANRSRPQTRGIVGFLANMVLLRTAWTGKVTFADLVRLTHATVVGAFAHQEVPFQMLPLSMQRAGAGRADDVVFQVMVDPQRVATAGGTTFELMLPEAIGSRFGVELCLAPMGDGMRVLLFHDTRHLDPARARSIVDEYAGLVGEYAADPGRPIG